MTKNLINLLAQERVFPIIRKLYPQEVLDIAHALIDGGVKVLEINVENPEIYKAIEEISKDAVVCAGGIITSLQAKSALLSGAKILSSPVFHMNLVKFSKDKQMPFIAGASTANEAYDAWKARVPLIKLYPIRALGGPLYVEDLLRPMPFLNVLAQGNVKLSEVKDYIKAGSFAVGVGRDFYEGYSYSEITKRAESIIKELKV